MKPLTPSQRFTAYVMKGPREASMMAVLFSCIPFLSWLSVVIVCLVTLRHGMKQGFRVLLWGLLPVVAIGAYQHDVIAIIETVAYSFGLSWLMSVVLQHSNRWERVIALGVGLSILALAGLLILDPAYPDTLLPRLNHLYQLLYQQEMTNIPLDKAESFLAWIAKILPGVQATFITLSAMFNVMIARALQASTYNEGGLKKELLDIRLDKGYALLILLLGVGVWLDITIAGYAIIVCLMPVVLSGLSFVHWYTERFQKGRILTLVILYVLLGVFLPMSLVPLMVISLFDMMFGFRDAIGKTHNILKK